MMDLNKINFEQHLICSKSTNGLFQMLLEPNPNKMNIISSLFFVFFFYLSNYAEYDEE